MEQVRILAIRNGPHAIASVVSANYTNRDSKIKNDEALFKSIQKAIKQYHNGKNIKIITFADIPSLCNKKEFIKILREFGIEKIQVTNFELNKTFAYDYEFIY